jgi:hypothetical protein
MTPKHLGAIKKTVCVYMKSAFVGVINENLIK